eukprot:TRINITY_DN4889_c0_g1_i1.p1 TRINITY_DN4889_c0_g1~~TRINITY_DN4889_c0_g1_i1.p1  ORF type:complete len:304 (-),score=-5.45 TRINITY_DN4889_c0_g1_i1:160-1071(-)
MWRNFFTLISTPIPTYILSPFCRSPIRYEISVPSHKLREIFDYIREFLRQILFSIRSLRTIAMASKNPYIDLESNSSALYPGISVSENALRWSFIRKVYGIISIQLLFTVVVASVVVSIPSVPKFFVTTGAGFALYIFLLILPFILLCPLYAYSQSHPLNLVLLGFFTAAISFAVGLSCSFSSGKTVLEALLLTAVVVVSLTFYTFWASRRGQDFSFLGPILFVSIIILIAFGLIQAFFPLGKISTTIYGALAALIFSAYIVYDTDNLIKRYTYDEYIWASVALYLDVLNLFLSLLTIFRANQ